MCAQLMNPDRPAWMEAGHPTDAEKTSAFDGFFAYCGKYEVDEAKHVMIHLGSSFVAGLRRLQSAPAVYLF